jgi:hypothetical protein
MTMLQTIGLIIFGFGIVIANVNLTKKRNKFTSYITAVAGFMIGFGAGLFANNL